MESSTIALIVLVLVGLLILAAIIIGIVMGIKGGPPQHIQVVPISFTQTPWDEIKEGGTYSPSNPVSPVGPDFVVSAKTAAETMYLETRTFSADDCAVQEELVAGPGTRKLLRFTTRILNVGNGPMIFGDPATNPGFHLSPCHGHYHFDGFSEYQLRDHTATVVITSGHKQAFCLRDNVRVFTSIDAQVTPAAAVYDCEFQGLSIGWADDYWAHLDGQWIDVTVVPPGTYTLRIMVNTPVVIPSEINTSNNFIDIVFVLT